MDFFEHQDVARRKTSLLVLYFLLAVVLIILAIYAVFWIVFAAGAEPANGTAPQPTPPIWNPILFLWVAGGTLTVVVIGSLTKIMSLSGGGESVARMLGARPVDPNSQDPHEKRLINVVEEIAIASGTQVPRVFLLEADNSINAFAAGFSTEDAIIGVTDGCMKQLSRDELQGVIAHEFSHILNGDMRLNIRLMGTLHGILVLGIIGYWIFWSAISSPRSRSFGGSTRKREGNPLPFVVLGLSVMAIGYIGVFFGKLIKSAVSRQREFLADASAVQFTRNPDTIAGALKKIGAFSSRVSTPNAEQASHLFFANGLKNSFSSLMATHPPLTERIRRLDPSFDGELSQHSEQAELSLGEQPAAKPQPATSAFQGSAASKRVAVGTEHMMNSVGNPQNAHLAYVSALLASLPDEIRAAAREPAGAQALLYGLLLNRKHSAFEQQVQYLASNADSPVYKKALHISDRARSLPRETRLPLMDMALATLRSLSKDEFAAFKKNLEFLAAADKELSLFEYVLLRMVIRHLDAAFGAAGKHTVKYREITPLLPHAAVVLSLLSYYGGSDEDETIMIFNRGMRKLTDNAMSVLPRENCELEQVDTALNILADASPKIKKRILGASIECILANGRTTIAEIELLRAIADSLECPMPPFLPEQAAA